jgi:hypothetical protein
MEEIFVCLLEVSRAGPSQLIPADAAGAFVRCYVKARDRAAALQATKAKLAGEHWCTRRNELGADMEDHENGEDCAREALETGDVVIGRTDIWDEE